MALVPLTIRRPQHVQVMLPVGWIENVARLPGKALHVSMVLLYLATLRKSAQVRFSQATLRRFSTSRDAGYDALKRLAAAGLVQVAKSPGRSPLVTLLDGDGRAMVVL